MAPAALTPSAPGVPLLGAVPPLRKGPRTLPGCPEMPGPPPVYLAGGSVPPWMLQRLAPANKGSLVGSGGAGLLLPALLLDALLWSFI